MSMLENLKHRRERGGNFFGVEPSIPVFAFPRDTTKVLQVVLRVLPALPGMDFYYENYGAHFQLGATGKDAVICTRDAHEECPICEVMSTYWDMVDPDDQQGRALLRNFSRKVKFITNIVEKTKPDQAQIMMFGSAIERDITALMIGKDESEAQDDSEVEVEEQPVLGDITSVRKGYWLAIRIDARKGKNPNEYYKVLPTKKPTPLAATDAEMKAILRQRAKLSELIQEATLTPDKLVKYATSLQTKLARKFGGAEVEAPTPARKPGKRGKQVEEVEGTEDDLPF